MPFRLAAVESNFASGLFKFAESAGLCVIG